MQTSSSLAAAITRNSSKQTYYTFGILADHERVNDAYKAYAYFRWVDDCLDTEVLPQSERNAFLKRQTTLLERCYRSELIPDACPEEHMLIELVQKDPDLGSGLHAYLDNMMALMVFDAGRRGRLISQVELSTYTNWLTKSVTEVMHYFIGHDSPSPHDATRYLAVSAAHITHMLRDTVEDTHAGYFNISKEYLLENHIHPQDIGSDAYRAWVKSRVELAREQFKVGRSYLKRVASSRCRLAGFSYVARFEWLLDTIEREGYYLRPAYDERKSLLKGLHMGWDAITSLMGINKAITSSVAVTKQNTEKYI